MVRATLKRYSVTPVTYKMIYFAKLAIYLLNFSATLATRRDMLVRHVKIYSVTLATYAQSYFAKKT